MTVLVSLMIAAFLISLSLLSFFVRSFYFFFCFLQRDWHSCLLPWLLPQSGRPAQFYSWGVFVGLYSFYPKKPESINIWQNIIKYFVIFLNVAFLVNLPKVKLKVKHKWEPPESVLQLPWCSDHSEAVEQSQLSDFWSCSAQVGEDHTGYVHLNKFLPAMTTVLLERQ